MARFIRILTALVIAAIALPTFAQVARSSDVRPNRAFIYHGKLVRPDGTVPNGSMSVTMKVYSPDPSMCLLWSETQTVVVNNGAFAVELGHQVHRLSGASGGAATDFKQAFVNNASLTVPSAQCAVGSSYTPSSIDDRLLFATFNDGGNVVEVAGVPIKSVPFALQAEEIGGFGLANLMKISGVGSNVTYMPSEIQSLKDLLGGDLNWDMKSRKVTKVADPVAADDAATRGWVLAQITAGGGGTGTVTSVGMTAPSMFTVSGGPVTGAGTLGLSLAAQNANKVFAGPASGVDAAPTFRALATADIPNQAVTYAKIQDVANNRILGRSTTGAGVVEELQIGSGLSLSAGTLSATNAGTVTGISSGNAYIGVSGTTTPVITANVGTAANTLAAGDDSRIVGALQKAGGTMTGPLNMGAQNITNAGTIAAGDISVGAVTMAASKNLQLGTYASDPSTVGWTATDKGKTWFNTTSNQVKYWDGGAIQALGVSGAGLTSLGGQSGSTQTFATGATGNSPAIDSSGNIHTLNVPLASAGGSVTSGTISNADYVAFSGKLGAVSNAANLANTKIWIGDVGGKAQEFAITGDTSLTAGGVTAVNKIKGTTVSAVPTTTGQVLRYDGTNYTPNFIAMTDLRSNVTGSNAFASSCGANQTLVYNSVGDVMTCSNIAIANTQVSGLGALATKASVDLSTGDATGTLAAGRFPALTGAVTTTAGSLATTLSTNAVDTANINAKAVTYAKMQDMATNRLHGRSTASAGPVEEIQIGTGLSLSGGTLSATNTNAGTVTSVGVSVPSYMSSTGGAITNSGTIALDFSNQTTNKVFAAPDGSTGAPSFRALLANDIPSLNTSKLTAGTLPLARGGTGVSPAGVIGDANKVFGLDAAGTAGEMKTITQGTGVTVTHGAGTITIAATGSGGTVTDVSVGGLPLSVTNGSSTPQISIAQANGSTAGFITGADYTSFSGKLSAVAGHTLAQNKLWVGNASSQAAADFVGIAHLRNSLGTAQFPAACTTAQTLRYNSVSDVLDCVNLAIANTQVSGLGALATKGSVDLSSSDATGTLAAARFPALTGDVTTTAGALGTTISNSAITDAKVSVSAAIAWSKLSKSGAVASDVGAVSNAGSAPSLQSGLDASKPAFGTTGRIYVASDTKKIYYDTSSAWVVIGTTVASDLTGNIGGSAANVTGTVAIANGGTGATTQAAAAAALLPSQSGNGGKYLTTNGTSLSWATVSAGGGSGCPTNYILVPALPPYTTTDFCVAKYEMKSVGGSALSRPTGTPWVSIDRNNSVLQCRILGSGYQLISNAQWQTVARNIEGVAANWSSGTVGTGSINRGHADNAPAAALAADASDVNACTGTGQSCSDVTWNLERRTHVLSNGNVIWDLGGNVWEWTNDDYGDLGVNPAISAAWQELSTLSATNRDLFSSANASRNSTQGIGQMYGSSAGAVLRGGGWDHGTGSGVFAALLLYGPTSTSTSFGFRCVFVP